MNLSDHHNLQEHPFIQHATRPLVVRLTEKRSEGRVVRSASFGNQQVWWELAGPEHSLPAPLVAHDMAATALVFVAMHRGQDLYIDGPVTYSLLKNMEDLIACWVAWRPDLYRPIRVGAAQELQDGAIPAPYATRAVAAFSGGLDASFTCLLYTSPSPRD